MSMQELKNYQSLLKYEDGKLLMEGQNLVEIANMYHLSVSEFFVMLPTLLCKSGYDGYRIVKNVIIEPSLEKVTAELFVDEESYESIKKEIFDFAYFSCSSLGDRQFGCWAATSAYLYRAIDKCKQLQEDKIFSSIYSSSSGGYNIKRSFVSGDEESYQKVYSIINKKH